MQPHEKKNVLLGFRVTTQRTKAIPRPVALLNLVATPDMTFGHLPQEDLNFERQACLPNNISLKDPNTLVDGSIKGLSRGHAVWF